jgi:hypothetical protein
MKSGPHVELRPRIAPRKYLVTSDDDDRPAATTTRIEPFSAIVPSTRSQFFAVGRNRSIGERNAIHRECVRGDEWRPVPAAGLILAVEGWRECPTTFRLAAEDLFLGHLRLFKRGGIRPFATTSTRSLSRRISGRQMDQEYVGYRAARRSRAMNLCLLPISIP